MVLTRDKTDASFVCTACGHAHPGIPMSYRLEFPVENYPDGVVQTDRDDELVAAANDRFILANIKLPVRERPEDRFVWTCWISLSHESFERMQRLWEEPEREGQEPAFGYVSNTLPTYEPSTLLVKSLVHTLAVGLRPWVELEPTEHPLAVEQREGIERARIFDIFHFYQDQVRRLG